MSRKSVSRREFLKLAGAGSAAAGLGTTFLFPQKAAAQQKSLKIMQWQHFVPAYDKWFDDTFCREWGEKHDTVVTVDHVNLREIPLKAAAEAIARKGHDIVMLLSPPGAYQKQIIDMTPVYQEVEKRHGKKIEIAHRSTFNPVTRKYFAFGTSYAPFVGNWQKTWWTDAGYPNGPDTWDELRRGAKKIRDRMGHPCGIGLSPELDTSMAMRALLWSFGAAEQTEQGGIVINSKETIEALKFMKALYQESETPEVFNWTASSNNQAMLAGRVSYVANPISITRQAEVEHLPIGNRIMLCRPLKGPVRRLAPADLMECYFIWDFADNKEGAQQFLVDYVDAFHDAFVASRFYNLPCFPSTCPNLSDEIANDPRATPADKYRLLQGVLEWTTNLGYPGYATAAIDETQKSWVIPTMFAKVARGVETPENAAKAAEIEYKRIFARWA